MKKYLLLFMLLSHISYANEVEDIKKNLFDITTNSCEKADSIFDYMVKLTRNRLNSEDASQYIIEAQRLANNCSIDLVKYGFGKKIFTFWTKTNYEFLKSEIKDKIDHYSNFRKITPAEFEAYKKYSLALDDTSDSINTYLEKNRRHGELSTMRERNSCQPKIDLRSDVLGPVRDQDSIGWCYAFAASDLLTYKLKKKISAADLAMNYNDNFINYLFKKFDNQGEQDLHGGWTDAAIDKTIKKGGACLEKNLKSDDNGYGELKKTLADIDTLKIVSDTTLVPYCSQAVHSMFPTITSSEYLNIIRNSGREEMMKLLSDKACAPRIPMTGIKSKTETAYTQNGRNKLFDQIDSQLGKKNIIAISYNARILTNIDTKNLGPHASVVVGRRFNSANGECEYLVRNSWGRGCAGYDTRLTCEEGNIWVPKSVIAKGIMDVTYL